MKDIPDHSIDMILCDLPYGTTACSWDSIIPMAPLWEQYWRITKPLGTIVLTASQPFTTSLIHSQMQYFKYCWVWEKNRPTGHIHAKNKPLKAHEDICIFSRGTTGHAAQSKNRMTYNPQGLITLDHFVTRKKKPSSDVVMGDRPSHRDTQTNIVGYPRTILTFPKDVNNIHPTQKPVALFEYLIRTYTNEGEVVLDNCSGSGTTAIAAERAGRRWICMERNHNYYEKSVERIKN
ncbi:MAG: site-specific DNA-methyltransferase [Anaerolineaceae bacterium]